MEMDNHCSTVVQEKEDLTIFLFSVDFVFQFYSGGVRVLSHVFTPKLSFSKQCVLGLSIRFSLCFFLFVIYHCDSTVSTI